MNVYGTINWEVNLPFTPDALDCIFPITMAGISGTFLTPAFPEHFRNGKKISGIDQLVANTQSGKNWNSKIEWDNFYQFPKTAAAVKRCGFVFDPIDEENHARVLVDHLKSWREAFMKNASTLLLKDCRQKSPTREIAVSGFGQFELFLQKESGAERLFPSEMTAINLNVEAGPHLTKEGIEIVLRETCAHRCPRLCYELLLDAEYALTHGQIRKSVLDAATAMEVGFEMALSKNLDVPLALKEYLMRQHNSLAKKRTLLNRLAVELAAKPDEYHRKIDELRNAVIHRGHVPSVHEAKSAFTLLKQTLAIYCIGPL
jgi:hypothetical protein